MPDSFYLSVKLNSMKNCCKPANEQKLKSKPQRYFTVILYIVLGSIFVLALLKSL